MTGPRLLRGPFLSLPPISDAMNSEAVQALNESFGFTDFREGQEEVIATILARQDVLAVMALILNLAEGRKQFASD